MIPEKQGRRLAAAISIGLHAVVFSVLAAGGLFSFLQHHSQPPVDVTVYNEDSPHDQLAANSGSTGSNSAAAETVMIAQQNLPQISETYTQEIQKKKIVKTGMTEQESSETPSEPVAAAVMNGDAAGSISAETGSSTGPQRSTGNKTDASGNGNNIGSTTDGPGRMPFQKARLIAKPDVDSYYPPELRTKNISGMVAVRVTISSDGTVVGAAVISPSGYPAMDAAALQIAYQCRYEPAKNEYGQAVSAERTLHIPFELK